MSASDATKVVAAVAPAVAPAAIPVWGPEAVRLVGVNVPIASMILSLLGLWMARAVSSAREGKGAGDWRLTCLLAVMLIGLVIDRQPTAGIAVAWGVGIGSSGILIVDLVKDWVLDKVRRLRSNPANDMADLLKGMNDDDDRR